MITTYTVIDTAPKNFYPRSKDDPTTRSEQMHFPKLEDSITTSVEELLESDKFIFTGTLSFYDSLDLDKRYQIVQLTVSDCSKNGVQTKHITNAKVIN